MTLIEILRTHDPSSHPDCHEAADLLEQMEWRSIETAPKDGTTVLAWDGESMREAWFTEEPEFKGSSPANCWIVGYLTAAGTDAGFNRFYPTHWKPRPSPPNPHG